jgi:hypothetical protein
VETKNERDNVIGTIEHTRKMLAFLETLDETTDAALALIRKFRAEIKAYDNERT